MILTPQVHISTVVFWLIVSARKWGANMHQEIGSILATDTRIATDVSLLLAHNFPCEPEAACLFRVQYRTAMCRHATWYGLSVSSTDVGLFEMIRPYHVVIRI